MAKTFHWTAGVTLLFLPGVFIHMEMCVTVLLCCITVLMLLLDHSYLISWVLQMHLAKKDIVPQATYYISTIYVLTCVTHLA